MFLTSGAYCAVLAGGWIALPTIQGVANKWSCKKGTFSINLLLVNRINSKSHPTNR